MAGETLDFNDVIKPDFLGCRIAEQHQDWNNRRQNKLNEWAEIRKYVFATDTTQTTNSQLPWKNKTTIPKACQIRDNLLANYEAALFPRRKWLFWEGNDKESETKIKRKAIEDYMNWVTNRPEFKKEIKKLLLDYIDYGNCFAMPKWSDGRVDVDETKEQKGYVGPVPVRINPMDIVFNPVANDFIKSPKIVRSFVTLGELAKTIKQLSDPEEKMLAQEIFDYVIETRSQVRNWAGDVQFRNEFFQMDGFTNFQEYLQSDSIEVLTFYGDIYDVDSQELLENHVITVVDRHKVLSKKPNASFFGHPAIYHNGWRIRQDNLWAMGPLDNLIGMQYRLDHVENLKSDAFDLLVFPLLKIRGYVDDFDWVPMERIYVGDDGDVELVGPDATILNVNIELERITELMEEMAGAPKEAMGFRTPGEKTKFEVQRLENAASRIFTNKIRQFEEVILEPLLNSMLELARRHVASSEIRIFDDDFKFVTFKNLTANDITGAGRIQPVAARHFAETAQRLQDLQAFFASPLGADEQVTVHFSSIKLAQMYEKLLDIEEFDLVQPFVRLSEQADQQRQTNVLSEEIAVEQQTPGGLTEDDFDDDLA